MKTQLKAILIAALLLLQAAWGAQAYLYVPQATIVYAHGGVFVVRDGKKSAVTASQVIHEGETLKTDERGYCILLLPDGEKVSIEPAMEVTLWTFFHSAASGSWKTTFKAVKRQIEMPVMLFHSIQKHGVDFEDESSNTLACAKG